MMMLDSFLPVLCEQENISSRFFYSELLDPPVGRHSKNRKTILFSDDYECFD